MKIYNLMFISKTFLSLPISSKSAEAFVEPQSWV